MVNNPEPACPVTARQDPAAAERLSLAHAMPVRGAFSTLQGRRPSPLSVTNQRPRLLTNPHPGAHPRSWKGQKMQGQQKHGGNANWYVPIPKRRPTSAPSDRASAGPSRPALPIAASTVMVARPARVSFGLRSRCHRRCSPAGARPRTNRTVCVGPHLGR